ncbi:site-2 protease family protein [Actinospongicola halichondriae]|uniref:site-2 protease family protein n=1 Tax=Actinospongicola halichondriae TaxID=3236844 RepID=UPI003D4B35AC
MSDLITLFVVLAVSVAAHELAHLASARLVGHEVFEIQIGVGPSWTERVGRMELRVGLLPIGGHVQTGSRSADGFRWRSAVVAGSGVVANIVLVVVGGAVSIPALVVFNVAAVLANLWPGRRRRLGEPSSDGRTLLDLLRGDVDAIAEERSGWFCVEADRARSEGRLDEASEIVDDGFREVGTTRALLAVRGVVSFEQRRFTDVVDAYAQLIDDDRVTVTGRAGFAADAAWAASLSGDPELARLAEPWAGFARAARPSVPRRRIVHALALVDAGRPEAAVEAIDGVVDPSADAIRVLVLAESGDRDAARTLFDTAVGPSFSPDHPLIERVVAALED